MACYFKPNSPNLLQWKEISGHLTIEELQANGIPSICDLTKKSDPTNLTVDKNNLIGELHLNWSYDGLPATFNIFRGTSSGVLTLIDTGVSSNNYTDSGLDDATEYFYEVVAVSAAGESNPSNEDSGTTIAPMTLEIDTNNTVGGGTPSDGFRVPFLIGGTITNANVDWGDGSQDLNINTYNDPAWTHTYSSAGVYDVKIWGDEYIGLNFLSTGEQLKLIDIKRWGENVFILNSQTFFSGCENLTVVTAPDIPNVTGITSLFGFMSGCSSLTDITNLANWDMENIVNIRSIFAQNTLFNPPGIASWVLPNVDNARSAFIGCSSFNQNINGFGWGSLLDGRGTFDGCTALDTPMDNWDMSTANNITGFLTNSGISQTNYDNFLISLDSQTLVSGLTIGVDGLQYTAAGAGGTARSNIITNDLWTFVGDIAN